MNSGEVGEREGKGGEEGGLPVSISAPEKKKLEKGGEGDEEQQQAVPFRNIPQQTSLRSVFANFRHSSSTSLIPRSTSFSSSSSSSSSCLEGTDSSCSSSCASFSPVAFTDSSLAGLSSIDLSLNAPRPSFSSSANLREGEIFSKGEGKKEGKGQDDEEQKSRGTTFSVSPLKNGEKDYCFRLLDVGVSQNFALLFAEVPHFSFSTSVEPRLYISVMCEQSQGGCMTVLIRSQDKDTLLFLPLTREEKKKTKVFVPRLVLKRLRSVLPPPLLDSLSLISHPQAIDHHLATEQSFLLAKMKFGVLYCPKGENIEEEMYSSMGSDEFDKFLKVVGEEVELKGWEGYAGGLDVRKGSTGFLSFSFLIFLLVLICICLHFSHLLKKIQAQPQFTPVSSHTKSCSMCPPSFPSTKMTPKELKEKDILEMMQLLLFFWREMVGNLILGLCFRIFCRYFIFFFYFFLNFLNFINFKHSPRSSSSSPQFPLLSTPPKTTTTTHITKYRYSQKRQLKEPILLLFITV